MENSLRRLDTDYIDLYQAHRPDPTVDLDDTLAALSDHRVETLLVSNGYREEGWRCPSTGRLAGRGPKNPVSGEPMERVADVVEEAVQEAFALGCSVEVCENADLDVLGRIGALLRF